MGRRHHPALLLKSELEAPLAQKVKGAREDIVVGGDLPTLAKVCVDEVYNPKIYQVQIDDEPSRGGPTTVDFHMHGTPAAKDAFIKFVRNPVDNETFRGWSQNKDGVWHLRVDGQTTPQAIQDFIQKRKSAVDAAIAEFNSEFDELHASLVTLAQRLLVQRIEEVEMSKKTAAALDQLGFKPRKK